MSKEFARRERIYQRLCMRIDHLNVCARPDASLFWMHTAALLAWQYHLGQWGEIRFDRYATAIGKCLLDDVDFSVKSRGQSVVHVTSSILDGGGHTEVLRQWVDIINQWGLKQHIVSSELADSELTENLAFLRSHVSSVRLAPPSPMTPTRRMHWIYESIRDAEPSTIILEIHPNDECALAAVSPFVGTHEVIFFNHADHCYNLGQSIAERTIQYRRASTPYALNYQHASRIKYVPLSSVPKSHPLVAKEDLGIPRDATVSITVGALYKLRPDGYWNYGRVISEILSETHWHIMIGSPNSSISSQIMQSVPVHLRSHVLWLGRRMDLDQLFSLSDFLIDSFPFVGGAVILDAMRKGLPIVRVENSRWGSLSKVGILEDYKFTAKNNGEVVAYSKLLRDNYTVRNETALDVKIRFEFEHSQEHVSSALKNALFQELTTTKVPPPDDAHAVSAYSATLSGRCPNLYQLALNSQRELRYTPAMSTRDFISKKLQGVVSRFKGWHEFF